VLLSLFVLPRRDSIGKEMKMNDKAVIEISGAGPAGLAAALAATRAGQHALVYERRADVGGRFYDDFQGLENWTTQDDMARATELRTISPRMNLNRKRIPDSGR